ncbi:olfactory receptor 49-like [Mus caroli]|uniref:Olfactory receptor 49-like n=1 Tax=Mus caroli TaxID=10089 RepID=A0A6P5P9U7_MUSCR|nr:olfactory receptor 49-like [Mus caroli]
MERLTPEETRNWTWVQEFVLEGFPVAEDLRILFFLVHLLAYLASIMGNTLIISITCMDHRLQTPMYFFLSTFSFVECCFITTVIPQLLIIFLSGRKTISFVACFTQAFFFLFLGATVFFLLYGSCVFIYMKPKQTSRLDTNREAALVNTVVTPLLNPVIYTLRNKQVHQALRDALSRVQLPRYQRSNAPSL